MALDMLASETGLKLETLNKKRSHVKLREH